MEKKAVMSDKMRLVNGTELYDISTDASQQNNIAVQLPEKVAQMRIIMRNGGLLYHLSLIDLLVGLIKKTQ
jgi:hypothetical protein